MNRCCVASWNRLSNRSSQRLACRQGPNRRPRPRSEAPRSSRRCARTRPRPGANACFRSRANGGSRRLGGEAPSGYIMPPMPPMPPMSGMPPPPPVLVGDLGDDRLGGEDVLGDRGRVLQRGARDHRGVDDAGADQVDVLAGRRVEADAGLASLTHLVDDDRALEAGVLRDLAERLLERAQDDPRAGLLVVDARWRRG